MTGSYEAEKLYKEYHKKYPIHCITILLNERLFLFAKFSTSSIIGFGRRRDLFSYSVASFFKYKHTIPLFMLSIVF